MPNGAPSTISADVVDLREPWRIGPVEVPTRLVLAPMAGVSVQAFGARGGASAPVSSAPRWSAAQASSTATSAPRLPPRRERRAPARDPALRLGPSDDGRGGAHGRGGRRRPRRPQLRLPREEGHEDRGRRDPARGPRPRRGDRRRRSWRRSRSPSASSCAAACATGARLSRRRARLVEAGASSLTLHPARRSRCTPARRTTSSRRSWSGWWTCRWSRRATSSRAQRPRRCSPRRARRP